MRRVVLCLVLAVAIAAAATPRHQARAVRVAGPAPLWNVVALGDSVPAGVACDCAPFVNLYATRLHVATGVTVAAKNLGVSGQTSAGLADMLDSDPVAAATVARADIVTITIGANDFSPKAFTSVSCANLSCYAAGLDALRTNLRRAVNRVARLRAGRPTAIRLTGYWEIWKDGDAGRREGNEYMTVGDALTRKVNSVIARAASGPVTKYVDIYEPFQGTGDDTDLLAPDGDHPNAAGHALIADALVDSGTEPLDTGL